MEPRSRDLFLRSAIDLAAHCGHSALYNEGLLTQNQRDQVEVVLVSPRNPLNIGAVARAMANFGFAHLTVAAAFAPHWREARSAVGAPQVLQQAKEAATLPEAIASCSFVIGTGTLEHRKPEQPVVALPDLHSLLRQRLLAGDRVALVLGPEKHGLTRQHLSYCHCLIEIPTDPHQPSMNLGQAAAVCLYEIAAHTRVDPEPTRPPKRSGASTAPSAVLDQLGHVIEETMLAAHYSPESMHNANRHDLRVLLRRLNPSSLDARRMLGLFRRVLRRLQDTSTAK